MSTGRTVRSVLLRRGSAMKVSDLAEELEVPPSAVLAQCQRFGIDASWAGAELSGADVVVLRAELANDEAIDLTPTDPPLEAAPGTVPASAAVGAGAAGASADAGAGPPSSDPAVPASGGSDPLPPTAVGSMPDLIEEVTPEPEAEGFDRSTLAPGFGRPGAAAAAGQTNHEQAAKRQQAPPAPPRFDRTIRSGIFALVVAVAAYVGSNFVDLPVFVAVLWLIAAIALIISVVDSVRGRHNATTHPDRYRGAWVATLTLVLAVAGIIGITASVIAVTTDDPDDAPVGLADLQSVQVARWGYQRATRLADNGWHQPTREVGTCWSANARRDPRDVQRVEEADVNVSDVCNVQHTLEVIDAFAYNREADSPYPGPDSFLFAGQEACGKAFEAIKEKEPQAELRIEYPDGSGWGEGDHDVTCVVLTPPRQGKLAS